MDLNEIDYLSSHTFLVLELIFNELLIIDIIKISVCSKILNEKCNDKYFNVMWSTLCAAKNFNEFKNIEKKIHTQNLKNVRKNRQFIENIDGRHQTFTLCCKGLLGKLVDPNCSEYHICLSYVNTQFQPRENYYNLCNKIIETQPYYNILNYLDASLLTRDEYLDICIKSTSSIFADLCITYIKCDLITNDNYKKIITNAIKYCPNVIKYIIIDRLDNNTYHNICLDAVTNYGLALQYINEEYQTEEMCLRAIRQNPDAYKYVKFKTYKLVVEFQKLRKLNIEPENILDVYVI